MVNSGKGSPHQNTSTSRRATPHSASPEAPLQVALTLAPVTHEVIKIERLGKAGERVEVSEQQYAELAGEEEVAQLVGVVQEAYEAGIADSQQRRKPVERHAQNGSASRT